jgi:hypothetical protein
MTEYPVIGVPPVLDGAVQDTVTDASPDTPVTEVGTPGMVAGTTALDALEAEPVPALFVDVTVKV